MVEDVCINKFSFVTLYGSIEMILKGYLPGFLTFFTFDLVEYGMNVIHLERALWERFLYSFFMIMSRLGRLEQMFSQILSRN